MTWGMSNVATVPVELLMGMGLLRGEGEVSVRVLAAPKTTKPDKPLKKR
jgi:hypothetical protein